ncbi:MAG: DUF4405 domain-containing protein [Anaerolineaceae bacterium]
MNTAKRNYFVDTFIVIAFLVVGLSALVFLVPITWIDFSSSTTPTFLWLDFGIWKNLHKWGGIAMLVGAVIHVILHWHWLIDMTIKMLPKAKLEENAQPENSLTTTTKG